MKKIDEKWIDERIKLIKACIKSATRELESSRSFGTASIEDIKRNEIELAVYELVKSKLK